MTSYITEAQWEHFEEEGYVRVGRVATDLELAALRRRIDDIMLGKAPLDYDRMLMQLDREHGTVVPGPQTKGHKGPTLLYRKIQDLELDPFSCRTCKNQFSKRRVQRFMVKKQRSHVTVRCS